MLDPWMYKKRDGTQGGARTHGGEKDLPVWWFRSRTAQSGGAAVVEGAFSVTGLMWI